ncbi:hypothetical protein [Falsibacillus pallidus]|uniref:hypothetical protein n=1 Tax=Falsibacillus pallidus TaxID=493781 RepID=UPI003D96D1A6
MSIYMIILSIVCVAILAFALIYTLFIAKGQKAVEGEMDSKISGAVKEHSYIRNPIFLTYIIVLGLALLYVAYEAFQHRY